MAIQPHIVTKVIYGDEKVNGKDVIDSFFCCDLVTMTVRFYPYEEIKEVRDTVFMGNVTLKDACISRFYQALVEYYG